MHTEDDTKLIPWEVRVLARGNKLTAATSALCPDYVKASSLTLPVACAGDFLRFTFWNPEACPVFEAIWEKSLSSSLVSGVNLCTDFPRYRVFLNGEISEEVCEVKALRNIGFIGSLLGCSISPDGTLLAVGFPVRHVEEHHAMPTHQTKLRTCPAGPFRGSMLVSTRPLLQVAVKKVYRLTESMELVHGAPIQIGAPEEIGIAGLNKSDFGETASIRGDETPAFWSSSATVQAVLRLAKLSFAITDVPGYPLIPDIRNDAFPELLQKEKARV